MRLKVIVGPWCLFGYMSGSGPELKGLGISAGFSLLMLATHILSVLVHRRPGSWRSLRLVAASEVVALALLAGAHGVGRAMGPGAGGVAGLVAGLTGGLLMRNYLRKLA